MTLKPDIRADTPVSVWFMTIVSIPIIIGMLWIGRGFLIPLAITLLLYILSSAMVDRFCNTQVFGWNPPRWLAKLASVGTILFAIVLLAATLAESADDVREALPKYEERLSAITLQVSLYVGPGVIDAIRGALSNLDVRSFISAAADQIAGTLSILTLVALYLVFLMSEETKWAQKIPRLASSDEGAQHLSKALLRITEGVKQYMWVNALMSALSATVAFLIFMLIDLDFAPLLALIVFVVGFIPNIGAFIGIILPSLVALIQFDSFVPFFIVLVGYGLVDQFIGNVVQPSMQGRSLNVSTFMVMVFLTFWATIWGGIGAFLAIPMMFVILVICSEIPATRWIAVLLSSDGNLDPDD